MRSLWTWMTMTSSVKYVLRSICPFTSFHLSISSFHLSILLRHQVVQLIALKLLLFITTLMTHLNLNKMTTNGKYCNLVPNMLRKNNVLNHPLNCYLCTLKLFLIDRKVLMEKEKVLYIFLQ